MTLAVVPGSFRDPYGTVFRTAEGVIRQVHTSYRPHYDHLMDLPYIKQTYEFAKKHKWYMEARMITVHGLYAFDPSMQVSLDPFIDIIGRNFKQPKEGLGLDNSPSAHMWRTILWPTRFL